MLLKFVNDSSVSKQIDGDEYTRESGLPIGQYTEESRFPCVEYTEESRLRCH